LKIYERRVKHNTLYTKKIIFSNHKNRSLKTLKSVVKHICDQNNYQIKMVMNILVAKTLRDRLINRSQFRNQNFDRYSVPESLDTKIVGDQISDQLLMKKSMAKLKGDNNHRFFYR